VNGALEKFRGWWVPTGDETPRLLSVEHDHDNQGPPEDKVTATAWGENTTAARCAQNPEHVPPVRDCVCGLWALNLLDVLYAWQIRAWERRLIAKFSAYIESLPSSPTDHVYVIGRVSMWDVIRDEIRPYPGLSVPHWRGKSARIEELWVPISEAQSDSAATQMATKLDAAFRRCRVHVGSPRYRCDDWDARTLFEGKGPEGVTLPDYSEVGLHQPPTPRQVPSLAHLAQLHMTRWGS
jgi:hypothetical protein